MRLTKSRIAAGGTPRRRRPASVGMRGSSQPLTWPPRTSSVSTRLRQHRVGQIEPRELVLMRPRRHRQVVEEPVVERPVVLELERADRVGDALDGVRLAVGEIVARIDAPGVAGARMLGVQDAVEHRVAQVDVAATPCRSWRAARARRWGTRRRACGGRGRDSPRPAVAVRAVACRARSSVPRVRADLVGVWSST